MRLGTTDAAECNGCGWVQRMRLVWYGMDDDVVVKFRIFHRSEFDSPPRLKSISYRDKIKNVFPLILHIVGSMIF